MNEQLEALRLATMVERYNAEVHSQRMHEDYQLVVNQLRQQHTEIQALHTIIADLLKIANGEIQHRYLGNCPDHSQPTARDYQCQAYQILMVAEKEVTNE